MILTNELMIGDWVIFYEKAMPVKARVEGVFGRGAMVLGHVRSADHGFMEPIPLTPEILEKNGFSQDPLNGHIFIFQEKSGEVIYYEYGPKYGLTIDNQLATIQDLKIKYVHQLQNALRLAGIERDITV